MTKEKQCSRFLFDVNDNNLSSMLYDSLNNGNLFVVAANGKVDDLDLLSRLYMIRECVEEKEFNVQIKEHYFDDGKMFSSSISFVKKDW